MGSMKGWCRRAGVAAALVIVGVGCAKKEGAKDGNGNGNNTTAPSKDAQAANASSKAPAGPTSGPRALLLAWVDAQNRGDYLAYEGLYADKFVGIKRAGKKTSELDRQAWLADRRRMFRKRVRVIAADIEESGEASAPVIMFVQTWESGSYRDRGKKVLNLVKTASGYQIAREELLGSERLKPSTDLVGGFDESTFGFVVADERRAFVVSDIDAPSTAAAGGFEMLAATGEWSVAGKKLAATHKSEKLTAWRSSKLALFSSDGVACEASVGPAYIAAILDPDARNAGPPRDAAGAKTVWDLIDEDTSGMTNAEIRREESRVTVLELRREGRCTDPLFAVRADVASKVSVFGASKASKALEAQGKRALGALPGFEASWGKATDSTTWAFVELAVGGRRFLSGEVSIRSGACNESGDLAAVWEIRTTGTPELVLAGSVAGAAAPTIAVLIEGQPDPLFISEREAEKDAALWAVAGSSYAIRSDGHGTIIYDADAADCAEPGDENNEGEEDGEDEYIDPDTDEAE